jgi:hypothetical protein
LTVRGRRLSLVGSPALGAAHARSAVARPARIRSRFVERINGLHVLEAGEPGRSYDAVS